MADIVVEITESTEQIVNNLPKSVILTANIPSTIFYTLDGTEPTTLSSVYLEELYLPTDQQTLVFKYFATDGADSSVIYTREYKQSVLLGRLGKFTVTDSTGTQPDNLYPYGSGYTQYNASYTINTMAGITVDSPNIPNVYSTFDGYGNPSGGTDLPLSSYIFKYPDTNQIGETGPHIGRLPSQTKVIGKNLPEEYTQQSSNRSDTVFNPRALVIFQDSTTERKDEPVHINRQYFSLENPELYPGASFQRDHLNTASFTGSFLKTHYNPRTNMLTSYYYDSATNRWIISTTPYEQKNPTAGQHYHMVFSRNNGGNGVVFEWRPFARRVLG
jgi:hypothetical protein